MQHTHFSTNVESKLRYGLLLSIFILGIEIAGGLLSNSLALLSDAGHVFTDVLALTLSLYGVLQAKRPSSSHMTFGYHRVGVIIALINSISIFVIAGFILYEAYERFVQPRAVEGMLMLIVASAGLAVNIVVAYWLHREQKGNLNVRSAFWHALGDALASVGVIAGGFIIIGTGWYWVDPLISVFISVIIFFGSWRILKEGLGVILEAAPASTDAKKIVKELESLSAVKSIHDVHLWSISPEIHALSCHVLIVDMATSKATSIREQIERILQEQFNIRHTTLQMECQHCDSNDVFCTLPSNTHHK
jgi:cobalt-zinc-cadmium efflux system protein